MKQLIALLCLSISALAEDLYVSQDGAGTGDGRSEENAASMQWFKNKFYWRTEAGRDGKIGAGDTVHFIGKITEPIVILKGGLIGQPIVFILPPNSDIPVSKGIEYIEFK